MTFQLTYNKKNALDLDQIYSSDWAVFTKSKGTFATVLTQLGNNRYASERLRDSPVLKVYYYTVGVSEHDIAKVLNN